MHETTSRHSLFEYTASTGESSRSHALFSIVIGLLMLSVKSLKTL
jgi:hypothetical protein